MLSVIRSIKICVSYVAIAIGLLCGPLAQADNLILLAPSAVVEGFGAFKGRRTVADIRDYRLSPEYYAAHQDPFINLEVIELVLLVQALQLGGYGGEIKVQASPAQSIMRKVAKGDALLGGVSFWRENTGGRNKSLWLSDPIIRQGEFQVGLYSCGLPVPIVDLEGLKQYRVSSHSNWPMVAELLHDLELTDLSLSSDWSMVAQHSCNGMSDLIAAPFTTSAELPLNYLERLLTPVPGVKLRVAGTRHFVISRLHPKGKRTYFSLQRGLRKLRVKGNIARALRQSGFLHQAAADWTFLN